MISNEVVEKTICKYSKVPVESVCNSTRLGELGYDSISRTELVIALEELINQEIPLEHLRPENMETVEAVKEMVKNAVQCNS